MNKNFTNKINALAETVSVAQLDKELCHLMAELGCSDFSYNYYPADFHSTGITNHALCTQQVQGWQEHYRAQHYDRIDPILHRMHKSQRPLGWRLEDELTKYSTKQHRVFTDAIEFGLWGGFAIPIHSPRGEFANLVVQDAAILEEIKRHPMIEHTLQLLGYRYHARVSELLSLDKLEPIGQSLTQREIECLRLTEQHKTAKEIARLLEITPRTVGFHIENVLKKLSVSNKHQAVSKANQLGLFG